MTNPIFDFEDSSFAFPISDVCFEMMSDIVCP